MKESEITINGGEWHGDGRVMYSYTIEAGDVPEPNITTPSLFIDGYECVCTFLYIVCLRGITGIDMCS